MVTSFSPFAIHAPTAQSADPGSIVRQQLLILLRIRRSILFRADQDLGNVKQATAGIYSRLTGGVRKAPCFVTINSSADRILLAAARAALSAPHAQFGGSPIGCARSTHFASARIRGSEYLGPTICSPTGSFAEVSPAGTLAAGSAASETRKVCAIQSM